MSEGVRISDVVTGAGTVAEKSCQVSVRLLGTLNRGAVFLDTTRNKDATWLDLSSRECIAGLRQGILGMQVGGRRELVISPHLGYGAAGLPGTVPPDAVLKITVELLEVQPAGVSVHSNPQFGRHLYFFWPGESALGRPLLQFGLYEDGRCGLTLTMPFPGCTWRHVRNRSIEQSLAAEETAELFREIESMPQRHPGNCRANDDLWADPSEKANSVTRDGKTNTPCVTLGIQSGSAFSVYFSLLQDDPVFLDSRICRQVMSMRKELEKPAV